MWQGGASLGLGAGQAGRQEHPCRRRGLPPSKLDKYALPGKHVKLQFRPPHSPQEELAVQQFRKAGARFSPSQPPYLALLGLPSPQEELLVEKRSKPQGYAAYCVGPDTSGRAGELRGWSRSGSGGQGLHACLRPATGPSAASAASEDRGLHIGWTAMRAAGSHVPRRLHSLFPPMLRSS